MFEFLARTYKINKKWINKFKIFLINVFNKLHNWMKIEPVDVEIFKFFPPLLYAASSALVLAIIVPQAFEIISLINKRAYNYQEAVYALIVIMLLAIWFTIKNIYEKLTDKKIKIPFKYNLALSVFSIPSIIFLHKIFFSLSASLSNNNGNGQQNKISH